jgi:aspartyl/glutamyl-tRNA(Asn/Gln) amidotransferase C subunit
MISKEDVNHIAKLARLGISKKEEENFQKNLSAILDYFDSLKEADVSGVEPTFHSTAGFIKQEEIMREDRAVPQNQEIVKDLLDLAPQKKDAYIKVKAVFE